MVTNYKAIDLHEMYDNLPWQDIILLVNVPDVKEKRLPRKIKVTNKRYLDVELGDDAKVQVLMKDAELQKFSVLDVPYENGEYRLDFLVKKEFSTAQPIEKYEWTYVRNGLLIEARNARLSEYAVMFEGVRKCLGTRELVLLKKTNLTDKDVFLQRVYLWGQYDKFNDSLFQKCLNGEQIDVKDFIELVDVEDKYTSVEIEFNSLGFRLSNEKIIVEKPIGSIDGVNENLSCTLSRQRLGITSLFFSRIIMEEDKNNTFQYLSNYYFA